MLLNKIRHYSGKGGLISESCSLWLESLKMSAKSRPRVSFLLVDCAQSRDLKPTFKDLSRSEKLYEIKPSLVIKLTLKVSQSGTQGTSVFSVCTA